MKVFVVKSKGAVVYKWEHMLLQLWLGQNGGQSVPPDFGLASSVIRAHVAHTLLVRVHVLHVVTTLTGQGDLGQRSLLKMVIRSANH